MKQTVEPEVLRREHLLVTKITNIFREREVTFFDAFQQHYDPLKPKNFITIKLFKELIRQLNLPLTVQDLRVLRRLADPIKEGRVELGYFCRRFDTPDLRAVRLNNTLDKVATAFYIQNFNLKKAFSLFDFSGNGLISQSELRQGFSVLEIGVSYDEIGDLMRLIDTNNNSNENKPDKEISYDEFI